MRPGRAISGAPVPPDGGGGSSRPEVQDVALGAPPRARRRRAASAPAASRPARAPRVDAPAAHWLVMLGLTGPAIAASARSRPSSGPPRLHPRRLRSPAGVETPALVAQRHDESSVSSPDRAQAEHDSHGLQTMSHVITSSASISTRACPARPIARCAWAGPEPRALDRECSRLIAVPAGCRAPRRCAGRARTSPCASLARPLEAAGPSALDLPDAGPAPRARRARSRTDGRGRLLRSIVKCFSRSSMPRRGAAGWTEMSVV